MQAGKFSGGYEGTQLRTRDRRTVCSCTSNGAPNWARLQSALFSRATSLVWESSMPCRGKVMLRYARWGHHRAAVDVEQFRQAGEPCVWLVGGDHFVDFGVGEEN